MRTTVEFTFQEVANILVQRVAEDYADLFDPGDTRDTLRVRVDVPGNDPSKTIFTVYITE